ncbi:hypothetical protein H0H87_001395 [Tephrocybe sp. NHM501043]|nr:hypothetical protein H0H87_001395 [Tephrocybe sp. NHM501043]
MQHINKAICEKKDYLELIPDAPFPARTLVKSVVQLILLGTKTGRSQQEVQGFALEIIHWVSQVKDSFVKVGKGRFTHLTWENLADMRSLIDEICRWAGDRLEDHRWNLVKKQIETFNDRSLILISGGLDAILRRSQAVISRQDILITALQKMKKSHEENIARILKEQERRSALDETLGTFTVQNSTYASQQKRPHNSNTQMVILGEILTWIGDHSKETSKNFFWLVGPPGCGKPAMMASVVCECQDRDYSPAQFFINRNDANSTNPMKYFPTVVRQVAKHSDDVEQHLHNTVQKRKFAVRMPKEASELFVDVVGKAAKNDPASPILVIFDGLDETARDHLQDTASIFSELFPKLSDYPNAKILISSRPEDEILKSFRNTNMEQYVLELAIDINDSNSRRDVKTYLEKRLTDIADHRRLPTSIWPGNDRLENLVERASGLFIWAVTAANYIDNHIQISGKEVMDSVLSQFDSEGMTDINTLYRTILEEAFPENFSNEWTVEKFRRLMGAIMVLREPLSIGDLDHLIDLRQAPDHEPVDIKNFVGNLRTLLMADMDNITESTISRVYKSFFDYIISTGTHIPERFHVSAKASNAELALLCLYHLTVAYPIVCSTHYASIASDLKDLPSPTLYSLRHAFSHMLQMKTSTVPVVLDRPVLDEKSLPI